MLNRRSFLAGLAAPAPAPSNPNVVLILADDMGFDLGCYRGEIPTPNLDRLAGQGVRFGQGYVASPICSPSRAGITTGQQPSRHLIFSYIHTRQRQRELGMRDWLDPQAPLTTSPTRRLKASATVSFHPERSPTRTPSSAAARSLALHKPS